LLKVTAGIRVPEKPPATTATLTTKTPAPVIVDESTVAEAVVEPRPTPL